jgi:hypothetical protein
MSHHLAWNRVVALMLAAAGIAVTTPLAAQRPDAELVGISTVGVLVEPLGPAAITCGFNRDQLEQSLARTATAGGLKAVARRDEDTYLDLRVETLNVQPGVCVSRFDTTHYATTAARLSHQAQPVPVRVSLLHEAGLSGGGSSTHAATVMRTIQQQVEKIAARVVAANR